MAIDHYKRNNKCFTPTFEQVGVAVYFMNHFILTKSGVSVPAKLPLTNEGTVASESHEVRIYGQPLIFVQK